MLGAASGVHLDVGNIIEIAAAAVAVMVGVGAISRRKIEEGRRKWRRTDQLDGWTDENGYQHVGVIDLVLGWTDQNGKHPGVCERVDDLEEELQDHREHEHEAP